MSQEIERKFLVAGEVWRKAVVGQNKLRQGYVGQSDNASVRLRVEEDRAWLTIKSREPGLVRSEFEYPIPVEDAEQLLAVAAIGRVIEKTRHIVEWAGARWEVDVFEGDLSGLVMAEIELSSIDEEVALPEWVGREVTDDPAYRNDQLARADQSPETS